MVRVHDLEAALDFYCSKLGLVETRRYDSEGNIYVGRTEEEGQDAKEMRAIALESGSPQQLALACERLALYFARCGKEDGSGP